MSGRACFCLSKARQAGGEAERLALLQTPFPAVHWLILSTLGGSILLAFLFTVRSQLEEMSDRIRHGGHALTAADFTVMVSNVPRHWRSEQLRAHFEKFGAVVHVGVSLDYRELTLAMQE